MSATVVHWNSWENARLSEEKILQFLYSSRFIRDEVFTIFSLTNRRENEHSDTRNHRQVMTRCQAMSVFKTQVTHENAIPIEKDS